MKKISYKEQISNPTLDQWFDQIDQDLDRMGDELNEC